MSEALARYNTQQTIYPMPYVLPAQQVNFSEALIFQFKHYAGVKESTWKGYENNLKVFFSWVRDNGITNPVREDIEEYAHYLASCGKYKAGTQAAYLRTVKLLFSWLSIKCNCANIADHVKGAKVKSGIHKKDALQREDVPAIANTIDRSTEQGKRLYVMFLLCISCALRTVEVSRANIEDIKTVGSITYLYVWGKGHDEPDAPVELPVEVKTALDAYIAARTDKPTGKSPLFVSTSNRSKGKRINPKRISEMLKDLMRGAGYDSDRLTAHSLRHTSATGAYKATRSLYLTQQHARHVDPATTEIYLHAEEREERHTEQQVYNYYFKQDTATDPLQEACQLLQGMPAEKLEKALAMLKML